MEDPLAGVAVFGGGRAYDSLFGQWMTPDWLKLVRRPEEAVREEGLDAVFSYRDGRMDGRCCCLNCEDSLVHICWTGQVLNVQFSIGSFPLHMICVPHNILVSQNSRYPEPIFIWLGKCTFKTKLVRGTSNKKYRQNIVGTLERKLRGLAKNLPFLGRLN